jgi:Fe2+ transport system protein FeoA
MRRLLARFRRASTGPTTAEASCEHCPLGSCASGRRALIVCLGCSSLEARRLRSLGVFEGASVAVVGTRNGILLDVQGARLALDGAVAMAIIVRPLV